MKANQHLPAQTCLICEGESFEPTGEGFDLVKVLERWEKEAGVHFRDSVWRQYGSPETRFVALYRCNECGFSMFLPPLAGSPEFYSDIAEKDRYYVATKWEFIQAIRDLKKHKIRSLLDVGCGNGYFLDQLQESNLPIEYAGYEFNSQIASQARTKGHRVHDGKFPEALLSVIHHEPFDAVCMFQVLEHVSDPIEFISHVMRLLAPDGLLIIGVPDAGGPLRHFSSALTEIPPHHVSRWYDSVFRLGMRHRGFCIVRMAYEPLPFYLWSSYLPVMLERDMLPSIIGKALNRTGMTQLLIRLLMVSGIRRLRGIPGHTLYAVLKRE